MKHRRSKMETYCFVIGLLLLGVSGLKEGDKCTSPEGNGVCKVIQNCETAIRALISGKKLEICTRARDLVVCCLDPQVTTTTKLVKSVTTTKPSLLFKTSCDSIPNNITVPMRKSLQKCLEYQERLVYPCYESLTPSEGMVRENRCNWKPEDLIIGGVNSYRGEFPHMVHLGYGENYTKWECGGVLVSENFVLTAGHCTYSRLDGPVNKIRIAFHKISEEIMDTNLYNVKNIYKHNSYKSPLTYNDIALLETDRTMQLGQYSVPACLHDGSPVNDMEVYAIGWGTTESKRSTTPDILQKVVLERFSDDECQSSYAHLSIRNMPEGYDRKTQICYGHKKNNKDSCRGDSGGPLQVKHPQIKCMYLVTGIVSNGKWCAVPGIPGINTRVASYLDWIESIVWP